LVTILSLLGTPNFKGLHGGSAALCISACQSGWLLHQPRRWGKCLPIVSCRAKETSYLEVMGGAVIEALQGKADTNRNGVVSIKEFRNYVLRRMRRSQKKQHPVAHDNPSIHRVSLTKPKKSGKGRRRHSRVSLNGFRASAGQA